MAKHCRFQKKSLLLTVCTVDKSKVKISKNFVAFSEYTNFTRNAKSRTTRLAFIIYNSSYKNDLLKKPAAAKENDNNESI